MTTIVIIPGGYHPFHAGHRALYESAKKAFPGAIIYLAATNDTSERPFPFNLKEKLAKLSGVESGQFVQVKSPFRPQEITSQFNSEKDVLIFVRSEKDKNESPKPGGTKKDGSPAYFQPWTGKNVQPFSKHAYMAYLPTVEFGPGITSATQIRKAWPTLNDKRKTALVMSLYPAAQKNPKLAQNIVDMFDQVMNKQVSESQFFIETLNTDTDVIKYVRESVIPEMRAYGVPNNQYTHFQRISSAIFESTTKVVDSGKEFLELFKRLDQRKNMKISVGEMVSILNLQMSLDFAALYGFRTPKKITKIYREPTDNKIIQLEFNNNPDDVWPRTYQASYNGNLVITSAFFKNANEVDKALTMLELVKPDSMKIKKSITEDNYVKEEKSKIIARTAKDLENPPKIMQHRSKRDQEREEQLKYRDIAKRDGEDKKKENDIFIAADPESDELLRFAQQHYPEARNKQQAFIKFVQRALKHSEEEDIQQDQEIAQLQKDVTQIKDVVKKINVSENQDYLDEK